MFGVSGITLSSFPHMLESSLNTLIHGASLGCLAWSCPHCMAPFCELSCFGLQVFFLFFLQSAMVMFDLAWMMSKDLNDMLWYVVCTHTHIHLEILLNRVGSPATS